METLEEPEGGPKEPPDDQETLGSEGLSSHEVEELLAEFGKNQLSDDSTSAVVKFLSYFWNPLSWVMELSMVVAMLLGDYADSVLVGFLLVLNACIGFWEEHSSGKAVDALKSQLQPRTMAKRDGSWQDISSEDLVPGDVILLKLGDVVPADCKLLAGAPIRLDQSSLTGESLPVTKYPGDECLSGATVKTGEIDAVVTATGVNSFFGRSAHLVQTTESEGHFQHVLERISLFCMCFVFIFVVLEIVFTFAFWRRPCTGLGWPGTGSCAGLNNVLVILVGGVPIAMPTVLSVTMAIGAAALAKEDAIVTRLSAVEELAGMDILCSDKTGTLTLNELAVHPPRLLDGPNTSTAEQLILHAALCSNGVASDAIDGAVIAYFNKPDELARWKRTHYVPFNPTDKRVLCTVIDPETGESLSICKGAPQIVLKMAVDHEESEATVLGMIEEYAGQGYRTIGVAVAKGDLNDSDPENLQWVMEGLIPLFDPPRHDTAETIAAAKALGVGVKMITGDQAAIARETCRQLNIPDDIHTPAEIADYEENIVEVTKLCEGAGGFSGVYPEHKYAVVDILQRAKHVVGMTGDGVNDAPALKKADIGIAVAGATDAARAASDIVLLSPGLGVIITAILGSRKIFQRMLNYSTYAITTTVRIVLTFSILTIFFNWFFSVIVVALMAILNDGTILTISTDHVKPSAEPNVWVLWRIIVRAFIYGVYLTFWTVLMFTLASETTTFSYWLGMEQLSEAQLRGLVYIQVSVSGQATIFITRSRGFWFRQKPSKLLVIAFVVAQAIATVVGIFGFGGFPFDGETDFEGCGWAYALVAWYFAFASFFLMDFVKFFVDFLFRLVPKSGRSFRRVVNHFRHPVYGHLHRRDYSLRHPFRMGGFVVPTEPIVTPDAVKSGGDDDQRAKGSDC